MDDTKIWFYVVAKVSALRRVGVGEATPVQYDPVEGWFEVLKFSQQCPEWVVREESRAGVDWKERLEAEFGVFPVRLNWREVGDFTTQFVKVTSAGRNRLFTPEMRQKYDRLMAVRA